MALATKSDDELASMSVDELDGYSVELKAKIEELRDERRRQKSVREDKVLLSNLAQRLNIDVDGITPEQAAMLLDVARQTPADVVVAPGAGEVGLGMGSPEVN